ncbi:restriction endonuclease subunit S [Sulfurimonas paralvinellae]|uniref:Type I restriction modification DNA specificity domain-containing protein n=1 Tax=Sulfurimonas paralvinellae TaxID=317658 RepID=A0A7M1B800_9BACT|nr:restriction endonuclease subunit S [Sulfurimonas paralvinellae]QOP45863.1 hypothetical protein FM071_05995 [Sulfurimonas paralvinellae]
MNELYELPDGWEYKDLKEVVFFQEGPGILKKQMSKEGIPLLNIRTFNKDETLNLKDTNFLPLETIEKKYSHFLVEENDILVASSGSLGKMAVVRKCDLPAVLNTSIIRFRPNDVLTLDREYLKYFLNSDNFSNQYNKAYTGTAIKNFGPTHLKKMNIIVPPLSEQQKIVSKLDNLFEKIDKSIALHQKNMDDADVFMGSVLNDIFEELEGKYKYTKMKDVVTKEKTSIKRGPFGSALKKSFFVESGYLVYEQYHALNNDFSMERYFINEDKFNELKGFEVKSGDIIISCSGVYLGKLAIIPNDYTKGIINQALLKLTLDKDIIIDKIFVYFWNNLMNNGFFNAVKKGAAIPNMPPVKQLKEIDIPLPPIQIQQKVVKYLDEISQKIEKIKSVQKEKMESLVALKASILDQAFKGEL